MTSMIRSVDDSFLLDQYVTTHSESAFAELTTRYVDLVYSACVRQLRDAHDAEDACQAVFIVLARKAGSIREPQSLGPWLLSVARFAAKDVRARKMAARGREHAAAQLRSEIVAADGASELAGVLDDALAALPKRDRVLLVMRYFEGRSVRESAERLGISENAASLRASRALRRLREAITRCGVTIPAVALPHFLLSHAIHPASAVVRTSAALSVSVTEAIPEVPLHIAKGVLMNMLRTQIASVARIAAVGLIVAAGTTWIVGQAMAQSLYPVESPRTTVDNPTTQPSVLIKSVLTEGDKVISRPTVLTSVGQSARFTVGTDTHHLSITFTPGEATGDFRPMKIEAKNSMGDSHWSLVTTSYFHAGEPVVLTISPAEAIPEQTLSVTIKTVTPDQKTAK